MLKHVAVVKKLEAAMHNREETERRQARFEEAMVFKALAFTRGLDNVNGDMRRFFDPRNTRRIYYCRY